MNEYLTQEIWKMREKITTLPGTPVVELIHVVAKTYQLLFLSRGCQWACTFCNYGLDYPLTLEMVLPELLKIRLEDYDIGEFELEANGSFLAEREIPYNLFLATLEFIANKNIPTITIETHYRDVTEKKIQDIRRILGDNQRICMELGFESADKDVRDIYNKDIDLGEYFKVVKPCKKYNIGLEINVLLGAPFLTREEQIQDCLDSLEFIFNKMPENTIAVIFPINIKENTMVKHWQDIGVYDQISLWELIELLYRVPKDYLDKLTIAWWGMRENAFTYGITQHPKTCEKCHQRLMDSLSDFYANWDKDFRRELIVNLWENRCECDL